MKESPTKEKCMEVLNKTKLTLRYGFDRFFKNCKNMSIPFYCISGGIDLFITSSLQTITDINYYRNFFLFSNRLIFNRKGKLIEV
jgi:2-hydroxy-3-keto-5-methylthiopentenyl-1-phosphate phosphatase